MAAALVDRGINPDEIRMEYAMMYYDHKSEAIKERQNDG